MVGLLHLTPAMLFLGDTPLSRVKRGLAFTPLPWGPVLDKWPGMNEEMYSENKPRHWTQQLGRRRGRKALTYRVSAWGLKRGDVSRVAS